MILEPTSPVLGLAVTDGNFIVGDGTSWVAESGATARTSIGLGTGDTPQFTGLTLSTDVTLARDAADILAQRNGTTRQEFRVYDKYTNGSSDEEWLSIGFKHNSGYATFLAKTAGTGTTNNLFLGTQNSNGIAAYGGIKIASATIRMGFFTDPTAGGLASTGGTVGNWISLAEGTSTATSGTIARIAILPTYNQASGTAANTAFAAHGNYEVTVSAKKSLGGASQIEDFLGAAGPVQVFSENPNDPLVTAWRTLGLKHVSFEALHKEDAADRWIHLRRGQDNKLLIDFSDYDRAVSSFLMNLGATPLIYLGKIPRILSSRPHSDDYAVYLPNDLKEWEDFVEDVVTHNVNTFGLRGIAYAVLSEPDHVDSWKGSGGESPGRKLEEHILLYAATYRGVKRADPTAKVGGPSTMSWQVTPRTTNVDTQTELVEWLRELEQVNRKAKRRDRVGLDFVAWQDYGWSGQRNSDGAEVVSGFLRGSSFDPNLPKYLAGSDGGGWSGDYLNTGLEAHQHASHILQNVIREFKDPKQRRFAGAYYYTFFSREEWRSPGDPDDDPFTPQVSLVRQAADGSLYLTPMYAAFQMMKASASGDILETRATAPIEAMAVRDPQGGFIVTINNAQGSEALVTVMLNDHDLSSPAVWKAVQFIDAERSNDGRGLEVAQWKEMPSTGASLRFTVKLLPFGSAQALIYAKRPAEKPSTA